MDIQKIPKYLSFGTLSLLAAAMAAATIYEKIYGTENVMENFYHSPVFIALWATAAISGCLYILMRKTYMTAPVTFMLHLSFVLILSGAFLTHISGDAGTIHLRNGEYASSFVSDDGEECGLPFSITLENFEISYYKGTSAPMDYTSRINISDGDGNGQEFEISMNNICRYNGYRLYQSSYDEDGEGSTLSVSHDPAGTAVSYTGYALLMLCMAAFFFQKDSSFRMALRRSSAALLVTVSALLLSQNISAADKGKGNLPKALPSETAEKFGEMYVYYNDRVCPMQTLARDFTMKMYGRPSYRGLSAEQVMTGWIFYYGSWKETADTDEKSDIINMICSGSLLRIFPYYVSAGGRIVWYASTDDLPLEMEAGQWLFFRKVMGLATEAAIMKRYDEAGSIFAKIREYQEKEAAGLLPAKSQIRAEKIYNRTGRPMPAAMVCLSLGIILFLLYCTGKNTPTIRRISGAAALATAVYLTVISGLRWHISGHIPMSNGFETMTVLAWITMVISVVSYRKYPLMQPFGFILCGFALLVATIGESDPAITPLMPVLSSPLLSIHVACMMISYSLLGIAMLNSSMALIQSHIYKRPGIPEKAMDNGLVILYPAVFFLTAGTFLGAIWANVSWGHYWAWDPKEVWALITMLVYAFALHGRSLKAFRSPVLFHWYCILAFLCVIITYFGVNFILGGLHSYA